MNEIQMSQHAGYLLKVVQHEIRKKMDLELNKIDLTTAQYALMSVIDEFPGASNAELARKCFVTPQTMILIVRKLEERSIIKRRDSQSHGRIQKVDLTNLGSDTLKKAHSIVEGIENELFKDLTESDLSRLCELLNKVRIHK